MKPEVSVLAVCVFVGIVLVLTLQRGAGTGVGAEQEAVQIEPATAPVFAEEPDYTQYPAALSGFTGMNLQQVAHWKLKPAMRARVGGRGHYLKGAMVRLSNGDLLASPAYDRKKKTHIYRSTDGGRTWELVETQGDEFTGGGESRFTCLANGTVLLNHPGGVYRSTDNGVTWSRAQCDQGYGSGANTIIQQPDGSLLVFGSTGTDFSGVHPDAPPSTAGRWRSTDEGQTWSEREERERRTGCSQLQPLEFVDQAMPRDFHGKLLG